VAVAPLDFLARDFRAGISGPGSGVGGGEPRLERIATGPLFSSSVAAELAGVRRPSWTGCGRRPASSRKLGVRPQVPGRRGGRLRDGGRHPGRGGQRGQPRPDQVEDLGHVRPDVVGAGVTGHAQHRAGPA
jgi:hypothetical protein